MRCQSERTFPGCSGSKNKLRLQQSTGGVVLNTMIAVCGKTGNRDPHNPTKECLLATDETSFKITYRIMKFNQNVNSIKVRLLCNLTRYHCFILVWNMKTCHNFKNHFVKKKQIKTMILIRNHKHNCNQYRHSVYIIMNLKFSEPKRIR